MFGTYIVKVCPTSAFDLGYSQILGLKKRHEGGSAFGLLLLFADREHKLYSSMHRPLLLPPLASGDPVRSETNKSSIGKVFTSTVIQNDKKVYASLRIPFLTKKALWGIRLWPQTKRIMVVTNGSERKGK